MVYLSFFAKILYYMAAEIKEKAKPYFLGADSDTLAVLIHGFTGTPYDLRELGNFLHENNISIKAPLLPGHGSHWHDLTGAGDDDWYHSIEEEIKNYFNEYKKIYLVGYSFGANLALTMAVKYPEKINGIISLGISVYLRNEWSARIALPIFHNLFGKYRKGYIKRKLLEEYEDSGAYATIPTKSVYDFYRYIDRHTKNELPQVKVPTLIIHSQDDKVTHPNSSRFVYQNIGSADKELLILDDVNHNPLNSRTKNEIFSRIVKFIQK